MFSRFPVLFKNSRLKLIMNERPYNQKRFLKYLTHPQLDKTLKEACPANLGHFFGEFEKHNSETGVASHLHLWCSIVTTIAFAQDILVKMKIDFRCYNIGDRRIPNDYKFYLIRWMRRKATLIVHFVRRGIIIYIQLLTCRFSFLCFKKCFFPTNTLRFLWLTSTGCVYSSEARKDKHVTRMTNIELAQKFLENPC